MLAMETNRLEKGGREEERKHLGEGVVTKLIHKNSSLEECQW